MQTVCLWVGCVIAQFVIWPEVYNHWHLQVVGWGQDLVPRCKPPGEIRQMNAPQYVTNVYVFRVGHSCLCLQRRLSKTSRQIWLRCQPIIAFPLLLVCVKICVYPLRVGLYFLQPSGTPESPTSLQSQMFQGFIFLAQDPGLGSPMWGSDPCPLGRTSGVVIIFSSVVCLQDRVGFYHIMTLPLLAIFLWLHLYIFSCRRSFLVLSELFH